MIKSVIVDDEPKAIELLESYMERLSFITCQASFRNPLSAVDAIKNDPPDLVLLDINMPELSGMSLAGILPLEVKIIFTTAYSEYAVKSYDIAAIDYLLKPIGFERFVKAISKIQITSNSSNTLNGIISLKSGYEIHRIALVDILFLEKDGNYMIYHTLEQKILVRENTADALEKLPNNFIQVHKSFIVALNKIKLIERDGLKINQRLIPVSPKYRTKLLNLIT